jgi:hypothetical protein
MSKLDIKAIVEDTIAAPGNAKPTYIVVSVEDQNGAGVIGLNSANFKLGSEVVGPGGSISHIDSINSVNPGVYTLQILPLAGQTWKSGVYIFSVAVHNGTYKGQTLCSCLMD